MGIVHSAFITTTCSKLLLWFVLLLMLPHTHTAMLDIHMPTPPSLDTVPPTELTPYESPESPQLLPPLLPEDMPLPEDTSPTLPELSMLPRERLRLMLMLTTDTTDMPDLMLTVLDTEATDTDIHMLTTERDLLMLSQRPRLMPLSSTEPMDMLVSHTLDTLPMVLTHMPTELTHMLMELTTERDPLMPSQRPMPTTDTTDMPDLTPTDMPHMLMELTHTVMDMPGESKLFQLKVLSYCKPKAQ